MHFEFTVDRNWVLYLSAWLYFGYLTVNLMKAHKYKDLHKTGHKLFAIALWPMCALMVIVIDLLCGSDEDGS